MEGATPKNINSTAIDFPMIVEPVSNSSLPVLPIDYNPFDHHQPLDIEELNKNPYNLQPIEDVNNSLLNTPQFQMSEPLPVFSNDDMLTINLAVDYPIPSGGEAARSLLDHSTCKSVEIGVQTDENILEENIQHVINRKKQDAQFRRITSLTKSKMQLEDRVKMQDRLISSLQQSSIRISKAKKNLENTVQHKNGIIADLQKTIKKHQNEISNKTLTEKVDEEEFEWDEFDYDIYYNTNRKLFNTEILDKELRKKLCLYVNP